MRAIHQMFTGLLLHGFEKGRNFQCIWSRMDLNLEGNNISPVFTSQK